MDGITLNITFTASKKQAYKITVATEYVANSLVVNGDVIVETDLDLAVIPAGSAVALSITPSITNYAIIGYEVLDANGSPVDVVAEMVDGVLNIAFTATLKQDYVINVETKYVGNTIVVEGTVNVEFMYDLSDVPANTTVTLKITPANINGNIVGFEFRYPFDSNVDSTTAIVDNVLIITFTTSENLTYTVIVDVENI